MQSLFIYVFLHPLQFSGVICRLQQEFYSPVGRSNRKIRIYDTVAAGHRIHRLGKGLLADWLKGRCRDHLRRQKTRQLIIDVVLGEYSRDKRNVLFL